MAFMVVKKVVEGEFSRSIHFSEEECETIALEIIEKLQEEDKLPPDTCIVTCDVRVVCSVAGPLEEMKDYVAP